MPKRMPVRSFETVLSERVPPEVAAVVTDWRSRAELAAEFGVTRQRMDMLSRSETFPAPMATLLGVTMFSLAEVREWAARSWNRRMGRPTADGQAPTQVRRAVRTSESATGVAAALSAAGVSG